jgi:hypothetical protein
MQLVTGDGAIVLVERLREGARPIAAGHKVEHIAFRRMQGSS